MLYTVAEISEMLGFSKVTIYNKINSLKVDLNGCIHYKMGVMHVNDKGLLTIRESLGLISDENLLKDETDFESSDTPFGIGLIEFKEVNSLIKTINESIEMSQKDYINSLLNQIELLESTLNKKDEQLNNTLRLLENSQVLIRERNEKAIELGNKEQKQIRTSIFSIFKKR